MLAAKVALRWIGAWEVDPDQLKVAYHHLTDLEQRVRAGRGQRADFNFHAPVLAVGATIVALCDAFGVERLDSYEATAVALDADVTC